MQLSDFLKEEYINTNITTENRDEAILELVNLFDADGILTDAKQTYNAILEREKIMTTGVGNGIAIPHCKDSSCPTFAVSIGILNKKIDFASIDKKKVKLIFLLVGPENNPGMHIKLLSRISRLLSNDELRDNLFNAKSPAKIMELIKEEESYYFDLD
jgi:fructose-specific phosphotransferase system IIA component